VFVIVSNFFVKYDGKVDYAMKVRLRAIQFPKQKINQLKLIYYFKNN